MGIVVKHPPAPGSEDWLQLITASKVPIILDVDPFRTPGELWMEMKHGQTEPLEGEFLEFGRDMEDGLINTWRRHNPRWQTSPGEVAYTDPDLPFPNLVTLDRRGKSGRAFKVIECKTTSSRRIWGEPEDELPAHVLAQVITQMGVSGLHNPADVIALCGYDQPLEPRIYQVEWDEDLWERFKPHLEAFYESLQGDTPPLMDTVELEKTLWDKRSQQRDDTDAIEWEHSEFDRLLALEAELEAEKQRLIAKAGCAKRVTVDGKTAMTRTKGRFSASRLPDEVKHLTKDPDLQVTTTRLDAKKFAAKYPRYAEIATGQPTYTFRLKGHTQ